jgi:protoporphyrinogen oxidase
VRYGVIGAGALGLTVALRLAEQGHEVTVLERDPVPGGLAGSFEVAPGIWLEKFYHHLFKTDRFAVALIEQLGLGETLQWHRPVTTVFVDDKVRQLDSPMTVLTFDPLPVVDRLRLAAGLAYLRLLPNARSLERRTAGRWMRQVMGGAAYETVWEPLLRGKFGTAAPEVSMAWLWARIHCRTAELGYIRHGFHRLYEALSARVKELGGSIVHGAGVSRIEALGAGGAGVAVTVPGIGGAGEQVLEFDRVISTLPTGLTVKLTPSMPEAYATEHPAPRALGAHCLILALDRPLTDVYWIGVNEPEMPFLAVVEHTNMVSPDDYGGRHLVYLGNYRAHDDPIFKQSKEEALETFEPGIRRLNPAFDRSWITQSWSFAAPFAQPIVTPAFARTIPGFDTPVAGLYVANMFQVYPYDRGQNYSIELAERLVKHLAAA